MDVPDSIYYARMAFLFLGLLPLFFGFRIGHPLWSRRPSKERAMDIGLPVIWIGVTIFTVGNGFGLATAIIWGGVFALVSTIVALAANAYILWQVIRYARRLRSGSLDATFRMD